MSDDDALLYGAPVHVLGGEDEPMAYYARFWRESRDPDRVWLVAYTPSGSPYPVLALRERVAVCPEHDGLGDMPAWAWHDCPHCGLKLDRDLNASLNILARGLASLRP